MFTLSRDLTLAKMGSYIQHWHSSSYQTQIPLSSDQSPFRKHWVEIYLPRGSHFLAKSPALCFYCFLLHCNKPWFFWQAKGTQSSEDSEESKPTHQPHTRRASGWDRMQIPALWLMGSVVTASYLTLQFLTVVRMLITAHTLGQCEE